jgi:hypothetical protein
MAKPGRKPRLGQQGGAAPRTDDGAGGETIGGYFRKFYKANPHLLKERSNEEAFRQWLADHPGHQEVPDRVKVNLQNVKNVLRKKRIEKAQKRKQQMASAEPAPGRESAAPGKAPRRLQGLEEQIDDCLALAKRVDREGLAQVIVFLRGARNGVVRRLGQA